MRRFWGAVCVAAVVVATALLLVPSLATLMGRLVANLWVAVMGAVAGILGGMIGA